MRKHEASLVRGLTPLRRSGHPRLVVAARCRSNLVNRGVDGALRCYVKSVEGRLGHATSVNPALRETSNGQPTYRTMTLVASG